MKLPSVEWSRGVALVASQLEAAGISHFLLPDLPAVELLPREEFHQYDSPSVQKIKTIAVGNHADPESFVKEVNLAQHQQKVNHLLIVGGNCRNDAFSTPHAIELAKNTVSEFHQFNNQVDISQSTEMQVWCVSNPNNPNVAKDRLQAKLLAGADRIITQPLLTSTAWDRIQSGDYPVSRTSIGMALPLTEQSLWFWRDLMMEIEPGVIDTDELFQEHIRYFQKQQQSKSEDIMAERRQRSLEWAQTQQEMIATKLDFDGVHYMPINNVATLLALLQPGEGTNSYY